MEFLAQNVVEELLKIKFNALDPQVILRAKGCVFGAFVGDALGSYLEFESKPTNSQVQKALQMPGGGPFHLEPGQITDDSELAISLGRAIVESGEVLNPDIIAKHFRKWLCSNPFDIGNTTFQGLKPLKDIKSEAEVEKLIKTSSLAKIVYSTSKSREKSQANGGLMRITPLALYCLHLTKIEEIVTAVKADHYFTHPNPVLIEAAITYVLALNALIKTGEIDLAFKVVENYINKISELKIKDEIKTWYSLIGLPQYFDNDGHSIGWAKIAWSCAFRALLSIKNKEHKVTYSDIMKDILSIGGDTDTNCCIVGGLVGGYFGFSQIPEIYIKKLKDVKSKRKDYQPYENAEIIVKEIVSFSRASVEKIKF